MISIPMDSHPRSECTARNETPHYGDLRGTKFAFLYFYLIDVNSAAFEVDSDFAACTGERCTGPCPV